MINITFLLYYCISVIDYGVPLEISYIFKETEGKHLQNVSYNTFMRDRVNNDKINRQKNLRFNANDPINLQWLATKNRKHAETYTSSLIRIMNLKRKVKFVMELLVKNDSR